MLKPMRLFLLLVHSVNTTTCYITSWNKFQNRSKNTHVLITLVSLQYVHSISPIWFKSHTPIVFIHTVFYFSPIRSFSYLMHRINGEHIQFFFLYEWKQAKTLHSEVTVATTDVETSQYNRHRVVKDLWTGMREIDRSSFELWHWQVQF